MLSGILCSLFLSVSHPVSYADPVGRLPTSVLDVHAPSARVTGEPGNVIYTYRACSPHDTSDLRARIVNVAAQEWGFFGMSVLDPDPYPGLQSGFQGSALAPDPDRPR